MGLAQLLELQSSPEGIKAAILNYLQHPASTRDYLEDLVLLSSAIIQLKPEEPKGYIARGSVLVDLGRYDKALGDLTKAIKLDPKSALAYLWRGCAFLGLSKRNEAIVDITTGAIQLSPSAGDYVQRAYALEQLGRHEEAFADLKEAVIAGLPIPTGVARLDRAMGLGTTGPKAQY